MNCKHCQIEYNNSTKDFKCSQCNQWLNTGDMAPAGYSCSDVPGVFIKTSEINQQDIEYLKEFEYRFRDGMVFNKKQAKEIVLVCNQIIKLAKELI